MTQRHKSFSSGARVQDPVTFDIDSETFTAIPAIPGARLLDFVADADSNDGGRAAMAIIDFLESVVIEDDKQRFHEYIRSDETVVEIETLAAICEWLVGQYTARPTKQPSRSSRGRSASGTGSTEPVSLTE